MANFIKIFLLYTYSLEKKSNLFIFKKKDKKERQKTNKPPIRKCNPLFTLVVGAGSELSEVLNLTLYFLLKELTGSRANMKGY